MAFVHIFFAIYIRNDVHNIRKTGDRDKGTKKQKIGTKRENVRTATTTRNYYDNFQ